MYIHTCIHVYIHIYINTYTHTYTHTYSNFIWLDIVAVCICSYTDTTIHHNMAGEKQLTVYPAPRYIYTFIISHYTILCVHVYFCFAWRTPSSFGVNVCSNCCSCHVCVHVSAMFNSVEVQQNFFVHMYPHSICSNDSTGIKEVFISRWPRHFHVVIFTHIFQITSIFRG